MANGTVSPIRSGVVSERREKSIGIWNQLPGAFAPFIPEQMKDDIAATGTVFLVLGCNLRQKTQFGPCWMVDIELGGQAFTIPFSAADYRDDLMTAIKDALHDSGPFDATLRAFDTASGHGWSLAAPNYGETESQLYRPDGTSYADVIQGN